MQFAMAIQFLLLWNEILLSVHAIIKNPNLDFIMHPKLIYTFKTQE